MKYQNYIFDLGNVLVHFDPAAMTAAVVKDPASAAQIMPVVFDRLYWDPLDSGDISDDALKAACRARLPASLHALSDQVYDQWMENLTIISGMPEILAQIRALGGKLYLLSNVSTGFAEHYRDVPLLSALLSQFDGLVFSGQLKIVKPDIRIFQYLLDTFGLKAEETFFIDDNAKNISGAERAGIAGYVFDGDPQKLYHHLLLGEVK